MSVERWDSLLSGAPDTDPLKAFAITVLFMGLLVAALGTAAYYILALLLLPLYIKIRNVLARKIARSSPLKQVLLDFLIVSAVLIIPIFFSWLRTEILIFYADYRLALEPPLSVGANGFISDASMCNLVGQIAVIFISPLAVIYFACLFLLRENSLFIRGGSLGQALSGLVWLVSTALWLSTVLVILNTFAVPAHGFGMMQFYIPSELSSHCYFRRFIDYYFR